MASNLANEDSVFLLDLSIMTSRYLLCRGKGYRQVMSINMLAYGMSSISNRDIGIIQ